VTTRNSGRHRIVASSATTGAPEETVPTAISASKGSAPSTGRSSIVAARRTTTVPAASTAGASITALTVTAAHIMERTNIVAMVTPARIRGESRGTSDRR
jgi:hypothetical protein